MAGLSRIREHAKPGWPARPTGGQCSSKNWVGDVLEHRRSNTAAVTTNTQLCGSFLGNHTAGVCRSWTPGQSCVCAHKQHTLTPLHGLRVLVKGWCLEQLCWLCWHLWHGAFLQHQRPQAAEC